MPLLQEIENDHGLEVNFIWQMKRSKTVAKQFAIFYLLLFVITWKIIVNSLKRIENGLDLKYVIINHS